MSKGLIAFMVVGAVAAVGIAAMLIIEMKRSAEQARKKSDEILREFKTVDEDLKLHQINIDSLSLQMHDSMKRMVEKDLNRQ